VATPARLAGVGVFVLGGLVLFTVGLFMIGDRQMAFAKKFTVYTEFKTITGLQTGAIVRVSGAKAGSITQILPPNKPSEKFRVKLEITENLHQLVRTDSLATIETEGLVGGNYLGIGTGTDAAPPVAPNATIAGKEPFDIADLMQQMGDTIKRVNDVFDEIKAEVQGTVVAVGDTVDNANALIIDISADLKQMAASGAALSKDAAQIAEGIRSGKGSLGKLVNDDELYSRTTAIAKQAEEIAANARQVVENANKTLQGFQSKDGPVQGMTTSVKQTMDDARAAVEGLAENMDALKHNFLLRGFFNRRGYFDLAQMSPADYRKGALTKGSDRRVVRAWGPAAVLFELAPDDPAKNERLTDLGRGWIDAAIAPYLEQVASGIVIVEGYAQQGARDEQYLRSRARASMVRDHLIGKFDLDPQATGAMPLSADSTGAPGNSPWDGVALAVILPKAALERATGATTMRVPTKAPEEPSNRIAR
jgi:phospholipid/cholesterol/gamma-HCH transport system substrate-binding protein